MTTDPGWSPRPAFVGADGQSPPPRRSFCVAASERKTPHRAERNADGRRRQFYATACGCDLVDRELRARVHPRVHPLDLRLHHHVLGQAALLALAEPNPALPLRRLRAVPAPIQADLAVIRTDR